MQSSMTGSKVNVPAVEDWQTGDKMTMEEQQDGREEAVRLGEDAGCPQISVDHKTQHREQTAHRRWGGGRKGEIYIWRQTQIRVQTRVKPRN